MIFHRHKWEIISAKPVEVIDWEGGVTDCTNILIRCIKCGQPKVSRMNGIWTLEEIKGFNFEAELLRVNSDDG